MGAFARPQNAGPCDPVKGQLCEVRPFLVALRDTSLTSADRFGPTPETATGLTGSFAEHLGPAKATLTRGPGDDGVNDYWFSTDFVSSGTKVRRGRIRLPKRKRPRYARIESSVE